jgi:hypothetical protein
VGEEMSGIKNLVLGLVLFFLVVSVFYGVLYLQPLDTGIPVLIPFVVFSGFFIFLVASVLVALSIFEYLKAGGRRK